MSARLAAALLLLACMPGAALAQEQESILSFASDIEVLADGSMLVTEEIRVRAEGRQIRRGIYRDFPTDYRDRLGNRVRIHMQVLEVSRDGLSEPWRQERRGNGLRLYLGNPSLLLDPGEYLYSIRYRTDRQLGYFEDHDELYWNVTGNGWGFQIEAASARIRLPGSVPAEGIRLEAFTGPQGGRGKAFRARVDPAGVATFRTTAALPPASGLTVVVSWPKGHVHQPGLLEQARYLLSDNLGLVIALLALTAILVYFSLAWMRVGRDPAPGVIFPHYAPPDGFSPASVRYLVRMGYDARTLTAAVINLAVKGYLGVDEGDDYVLSRQQEGRGALAPGEQVLLQKLFADGDVLRLEKANHSLISAAMRAHRRALKRDYEVIYFKTNSGFLVPAFLLLALALVPVAGFGLLTPMAIAVLGLAAGAHVLFYFLLRAPTMRGRQVLDKIEGFKQYLEVAEQEEMNLRNPPHKTPELFEAFLPYALALDVEQAWAEKFAALFSGLAEQTGRDYQPAWYSGEWNPHRVGSFASSMGSSFSDAIASASTPPGSSSGSGGGGSSGGGGGGGGGGGW